MCKKIISVLLSLTLIIKYTKYIKNYIIME